MQMNSWCRQECKRREMTGHAAKQAASSKQQETERSAETPSKQAHLRPRLVVRPTVGDIGRLLVEGWRETEVAATKAAAGGQEHGAGRAAGCNVSTPPLSQQHYGSTPGCSWVYKSSITT